MISTVASSSSSAASESTGGKCHRRQTRVNTLSATAEANDDDLDDQLQRVGSMLGTGVSWTWEVNTRTDQVKDEDEMKPAPSQNAQHTAAHRDSDYCKSRR